MKKINLFFYLPFLFSFSFLWKINLFPGASVNFLDIFLFVAILIGFWTLFKRKLFVEFKNYWLEKRIFSFLLISVFLLSAFFSYGINSTFNNWTTGLGVIKSFLVLPIIFSMFVVFFINKTSLSLLSLKKCFFFSMSLVSLLGITAIVTKNLTFDKRLNLFYDSPNHFAMMLSPAIIIGIWLLFHKKITNKKYFLLIFLAVLLLIVNLIFTKSFGSIIAIISSILFLLISKNIFLLNVFKKTLFLTILLSTLFLLNISFFIKNNHLEAIPPSSFDSRITIYQATEKIIKHNFIKGVGPGNFQENYLIFQKYFLPYPEWAVPHAHNNLLHIYVELGMFAFFAFFGLIFLKTFSFKQKKPTKILAFSILIYFIIHGLFDTTIWQNDTALLFWLLLLL